MKENELLLKLEEEFSTILDYYYNVLKSNQGNRDLMTVILKLHSILDHIQDKVDELEA